jgi:hypothetical protein
MWGRHNVTRKPKAVLPDDLDLDAARVAPGAAERPAFLHEQAASAASVPAPAAITAGVKASTVATTLYLMPADHRRLRMMAIERNASMQTLLLDALDMLMAEAGLPPVERWETRRKEGVTTRTVRSCTT